MKTSILEVGDMLSVLTVDEVETRIREVAGVESATVNYDAKNATVRYDETLLVVADIKVLVHQRGQQSVGESEPAPGSERKPAHEHTAELAPTSALTPEPTVPKAAPAPPPAPHAPKASTVEAKEGDPAPGAPPSSAPAVHA